jgi:hypothetical protein
MIRRAALAPLFLVTAVVVIAACNEGGGVASPSNTPHGSRCLMDTDCMGGYECSKGKGDILGECVPKTMGGVGAGGGGGGGAAKPAGSGGTGGAGGAGASAGAGSASGKPAEPPKPKTQTPEPLPPPKPPKDVKPTDSTFSP